MSRHPGILFTQKLFGLEAEGKFMTQAALSPEGRITTGLHSIGCNQKQFAEIAACMQIPVSESLINLCLCGKRSFTPWTAQQLLGLMEELLALRDYFAQIPINWRDFERVSMLVTTRRVQQAGEDVDRAAAAKAAQ
jgi:hypothetical protein